MWFVAIGVLFLLLKYFQVAGAETWAWYVIYGPFGLAVLWWAWADKTGYYQRREMKKLEAKKRDRVNKSLEALGLEQQRKKRRF